MNVSNPPRRHKNISVFNLAGPARTTAGMFVRKKRTRAHPSQQGRLEHLRANRADKSVSAFVLLALLGSGDVLSLLWPWWTGDVIVGPDVLDILLLALLGWRCSCWP